MKIHKPNSLDGYFWGLVFGMLFVAFGLSGFVLLGFVLILIPLALFFIAEVG